MSELDSVEYFVNHLIIHSECISEIPGDFSYENFKRQFSQSKLDQVLTIRNPDFTVKLSRFFNLTFFLKSHLLYDCTTVQGLNRLHEFVSNFVKNICNFVVKFKFKTVSNIHGNLTNIEESYFHHNITSVYIQLELEKLGLFLYPYNQESANWVLTFKKSSFTPINASCVITPKNLSVVAGKSIEFLRLSRAIYYLQKWMRDNIDIKEKNSGNP